MADLPASPVRARPDQLARVGAARRRPGEVEAPDGPGPRPGPPRPPGDGAGPGPPGPGPRPPAERPPVETPTDPLREVHRQMLVDALGGELRPRDVAAVDAVAGLDTATAGTVVQWLRRTTPTLPVPDPVPPGGPRK